MSSLRDNVVMLHATMEMYAHAKRFNERWLSDPMFRTTLFQDPEQAISTYALAIDVDEARGIVEGDTEQAGSLARGIYAISAIKSAVMDRWYGAEATAADPRIDAWRARQQARMRLELGAFPTKASVRAAWNAELTLGCSGGCWFCNMAAPGLSGIAPANDADLGEWRELVRVLRGRLGPAIRTGYLDGASDPFDHPAYEEFCRVVLHEAGFYPPTSTAFALRDPDRSRRFFAEAKAAGCWSVRLTVRDREELDALHATFSPEELAHVQLNAFTPESTFVFSLAGRYRDRFLSDPAFASTERRKLAFAPWYTMSKDYTDHRDYPLDANTGVVGFSINMVTRHVSLVAPRPSSDAFPLGFETLDRRSFDHSDDFASAIDAMIERWMPLQLRDADRISFWQGLRCEEIDGGVRLHGRFRQSIDIVDPDHAPQIRQISDALKSGTSLGEITPSAGTDRSETAEILHRFFEAGVLQEEPAA